MIILFGEAQSILKQGTLNNVNCPNCNKTGQFIYTVSMEYLHFFAIPTAPSRKVTQAHCTNCSHVFDFKYLPTTLQKKIEFESFGIGTPVKYYSGIILGLFFVIIFIIGSVFLSMKNKKERDVLIANPSRGDIYSYETEDGSGHYSTLKIAYVMSDTIYVFLNNYETDKRSGIYQIDKLKNYTLDRFAIPKTEIDSMYQNGNIYDIDRED